jgi:GH24 family phage-related lysozyme (muramidase)
MITTTSERGRAFLGAHEGDVLTCYLDPVGIPTIGRGFTMRSRAVRAALAKLGINKLVPGKTKITKAQSAAILNEVLAAEFEPAVVKNSPADRKQHEMDAATSAVFNLGTGAMGWRWAQAWRAGDIKKAAQILGSNYNTAGGRKLPGLVRRRREEADLFLNGNYGDGKFATKPEGVNREASETKPAMQDPVVREAQELLTAAGFNPGAIDGWMGAKTKAAVIAYQKAHPHLVADGIIGPATLAQLRKDVTVARETVTKGAGSGIGSAALAWSAGLPWGWIAAGVVVAVVGYVIWRKRDVIARRINTWRDVEVPV